MPSKKTTCIRNADWVVAWDKSAERHCYLRGADVAFAGDTILHVGRRFDGPVDEEVSGKALCVMPGLVNVHNHPSNQPAFKGVREELGNPNFYMSALYDGRTSFAFDPADRPWNAQYAYCEMLRSGVTTFVDMCFPYPGWLDIVSRSGLRAYVSPLYESAHWTTANGYQLTYGWEDDKGEAAFAAAMRLIDEAEAHPCGLLTGMISPMAVDTCTPELIRRSLDIARDRKRPFQLHAGEAVMEFLEMTRRVGKTSVQYLKEIGILGPTTTLGHGLFLDHHSWLHWHTREDLNLLADSGTMVAHCPNVFSRYGITMEHLGEYLARGVTIGIGTDTHPHNMLEEMRCAAIMARVAAENTFSIRTSDVFHAATVGGAKILLRDDIGRLAPGAKADIVLVDLDEPAMKPVYDPIRCLVYTAADRAVRDVYVNGVKVVENHEVLTLDYRQAADRISEIQQAMLAKVPSRDHSGRTAQQISPLTLPVMEA